MRIIFQIFRTLLVAATGRGYDRSDWLNALHHKLAYRLHRLLPLFGIRGVQRIPIGNDRHLYVRAEDGGVGHQWIMYRQYEPFETSLVKQHLKPGMTVYNIGANIGYYAVVASDCVGKTGRVFAFEPAPENLELLSRTVAENNLANVQAMPIAVGSKDGSAMLALSSTNSGDHQISRDGREDRATTAVTIRSVDSLIAEAMPDPDAIIMDVQGSELEVLQGMSQLFARKTVRTIFTEFWPAGLDARHSGGAQELLSHLTNAGFALWVIDEKRREITSQDPADILSLARKRDEINLLCMRS